MMSSWWINAMVDHASRILVMLMLWNICVIKPHVAMRFNITISKENLTTSGIMYCNRTYFEESFVIPGNPVPENIVEFMRERCPASQCDHSVAYPYWSFTKERVNLTSTKYSFGMFRASPDDDCWYYLIELQSKGGKLIFRKFYKAADLPLKREERSPIKFLGNLRRKDLGKSFDVSLTMFPSGNKLTKTSPMPENDCQLIVVHKTIQYYWSNYEFKKNSSCDTYYQQKNIQGVAERFCSHFNDPSEQFIRQNLNKHLEKKHCNIYLNLEKRDSSTFDERYLWIALSFFTLLILSLVSYKFYVARKRGSLPSVILPSSYLAEHKKVKMLLNETKISVMILHRPGCEILDSLIRDFSFILHSYGIEINSPLLEMSQIDAEGGIATYIQRNVDSCTYILIMVTDHSPESIHHSHRPFEFAIKMLSGLAFRENECARYIPVYFKDYNEIVKDIPTFLFASTVCGFQIPHQIKDLVMHMKQSSDIVENKNTNNKMNFFFEKMKAQVRQVVESQHSGCCIGQCQQGTIKDDVSVLWPTTENSITTYRLYEDTESVVYEPSRCTKLIVEEDNDMMLSENVDHHQKVEEWCCNNDGHGYDSQLNGGKVQLLRS